MFRRGTSPPQPARRRTAAAIVVALLGATAAATAAGATSPPTGPDTSVPGTEAPATDAPGTDVPGTDAPGTDAPGSEAPGSDAPSSSAPAATDAPGTAAPEAPAATLPADIDTEGTAAIGIVLEPTNLDIVHQAGAALEQLLLDNVYETLLTGAPDGTTSPGLASLEISEDGLTYTFTLPEGVTFHDGDPLTASDVVATLEETKANGVNKEDFSSVETIEAPDDLTVVLTLSQPDSELAFNLSRRGGVVLNEGATDVETSANGTGPFTLAEWSQGSSITLERNDDYWGEPANVAEVVFQFYPEPNALVNALSDGDIDIAVAVNTDLIGEFEDNPDWVITSGPSNGEFTLGYNNGGEVLSDQRVRQAITQAIDKAGVQALFNGYGTIVGAPVPPFDPWYEDLTGLYPYDPDAARALLEEAGYGDGLTLSFVVPNHYPQSIADYVVSQLGDVGITVDLQLVEFPTWLEQVYTNHDYDLTAVLHVEPRDIFNYGNPDYYWQYNNPEVIALLDQSRLEVDVDASNELRRQAAAIIAEDAATNVLIVYDDVIVANTRIYGYPTFDANSRFDVTGVAVTS
ncbi:ABC transporter substrate-binding protein [Desertimonas flava]|uniref:ABC transporter substrate-binding protein n=1 Tax=Desertimonas flava TaxID=2064846 RepID=UPI000E34794F|nr:ABC transporter substrate-binding protein [Desertimonas flava]